MKDFTVGLALLDYVPVIEFGIAIILIGVSFGSPMFMVGAVISMLAGVMKATWKLIIGVTGKNIQILNKPFIPMQSSGMLIMIVALVINFKRINLEPLFAFPTFVFAIMWMVIMGCMVWYKKNKFVMDSAKSNWTAEIINSVGQMFFLLTVLSVGGFK